MELKTKPNPNFYHNEYFFFLCSTFSSRYYHIVNNINISIFKNIVFSDNLKKKNVVLSTWESHSVYPQESDFNYDVSSEIVAAKVRFP